jgi:hypothetical protein
MLNGDAHEFLVTLSILPSASLEILKGCTLPVLRFGEVTSGNDEIAEHANVSSCNAWLELQIFSGG